VISTKTILVSVLMGLLTSFTMGNAYATGDADAGKNKSASCGACHGADGNSVNPAWPSIAGQHSVYIQNALQSFKDGTRSDVLMTAQAMGLSDQDIADLAAYYASQKAVKRTANPALAETGERLYRGGKTESNLTACIGCHGPTGRGNAPAGYPSLTGQHAAYSAKQLDDYQSGARRSDGKTQIMRNIAARLTQDEINSLAAYLQGLR
jgi:cytochrome c553